MSKTNFTLAIYLSAMFMSGVAVGGFGHRLLTAESVSATQRRPSPEEFRRAYTQELRTKLRLDEKQFSAVNGILDDTRSEYREFRKRHKVELDQIQEAQVARIRAILSEEQRAEYERYRSERERQRQHDKKE